MEIARLHGQDLAYRRLGGGKQSSNPTVLLVHGIGHSSETWEPVLQRLTGSRLDVLAVDLPGHGQSSKARGDYSLGALASTLRDLLDSLNVGPCVVVGHSLGGGVAMQFGYQFPERLDKLVLVASGGLGADASPFLRAATLPGAEIVLQAITHPRAVGALSWLANALPTVGVRSDSFSDDALRTLRELEDPSARSAFLATLRSVVDFRGQRVSAISKIPSNAHVPTLLVWGDRDPIIPIEHGRHASELFSQSRLVVFPGAGHEPHRFDPDRFAELLTQFASSSGVEVAQPRPRRRPSAARA